MTTRDRMTTRDLPNPTESYGPAVRGLRVIHDSATGDFPERWRIESSSNGAPWVTLWLSTEQMLGLADFFAEMNGEFEPERTAA